MEDKAILAQSQSAEAINAQAVAAEAIEKAREAHMAAAVKVNRDEALEIFTPDVMQDVIDNYQSYGLEFSNDTLYLYPMKLIEGDDEFMQALALIERLAKNLSSVLGAMAQSDSSEQPLAQPQA